MFFNHEFKIHEFFETMNLLFDYFIFDWNEHCATSATLNALILVQTKFLFQWIFKKVFSFQVGWLYLHYIGEGNQVWKHYNKNHKVVFYTYKKGLLVGNKRVSNFCIFHSRVETFSGWIFITFLSRVLKKGMAKMI